jgi:hypothetical protein
MSVVHRGREASARDERRREAWQLAAGLALLLGGVVSGALLYGRHGVMGVTCDELVMGAGFGVLLIGFLLSLVGRGRGERVVRVAQEHGAALPGHAGMTLGGRRRG